MYNEFFAKALELTEKDEPFAIAIVVNADKPTSARPGDKAIVTAQGTLHGWIGGSCALPTVITEAKKALADGKARLIRLTTDPDQQVPRTGVMEMPMTCFSGGTLEIYIEPQHPVPRLMVIGGLPVAHALIRLGKVMDYRVIAVDPDAVPAQNASEEHTHELITDLNQIAPNITPFTYVVVASHGNYDEIALEHVLRSKAPYVALVASKTRLNAVQDYLKAQGLTQDELSALKCPAGLDIQAVQPDEIAVSILAEIIQRRRNRSEYPQIETAEPAQSVASEPTEAIDPVCEMTVEIATAKYKYEYKGQMYYFCAPGCKRSFEKAPELYLHAPNVTLHHP
jgi:xanthine dehydrogenase accessory factor